MITSAEGFIRLRTSELKEEQERASHDSASTSVWVDLIDNYPEYKVWVVHNKSIPIDILETLAKDEDAEVREAVARKRKINDKIFNWLAVDTNENVKYALICNTKLPKDKKKLIDTEHSEWLKNALDEQLSKVE
ncbi:hypothetical protein J7E24_06805 [Hymenobacter sp. ISL-91]|uniref:hypothetical protein n=1 Tax=Hymenobacter sp. ISL-91 TaxID=2819151 RepID=UPI001BE9EB62|nr:hypothetical protein [Hymenobacter sp. ISL-91]MBT2557489.1 hypothetical protein [Hymenobacter sp. ISL-91]